MDCNFNCSFSSIFLYRCEQNVYFYNPNQITTVNLLFHGKNQCKNTDR